MLKKTVGRLGDAAQGMASVYKVLLMAFLAYELIRFQFRKRPGKTETRSTEHERRVDGIRAGIASPPARR